MFNNFKIKASYSNKIFMYRIGAPTIMLITRKNREKSEKKVKNKIFIRTKKYCKKFCKLLIYEHKKYALSLKIWSYNRVTFCEL